ncbi:hypothetical protein TanjilG_17029 [Lupinus angustifolius]|nr:hypothetical protein TanjilG_17029 [Lupinus angustifolius]
MLGVPLHPSPPSSSVTATELLRHRHRAPPSPPPSSSVTATELLRHRHRAPPSPPPSSSVTATELLRHRHRAPPSPPPSSSVTATELLRHRHRESHGLSISEGILSVIHYTCQNLWCFPVDPTVHVICKCRCVKFRPSRLS